eukprot:6209865-Pleurochrysis_carterae.AAC.4
MEQGEQAKGARKVLGGGGADAAEDGFDCLVKRQGTAVPSRGTMDCIVIRISFCQSEGGRAHRDTRRGAVYE